MLLLLRQSGFLGLDDFVTSENAIPGAKLGEYAEVRSLGMALCMVADGDSVTNTSCSVSRPRWKTPMTSRRLQSSGSCSTRMAS